MLDSYIILNRNPKIIIKLFTYTSLALFVLLIYLSNIINYTSYFKTYSYITFIDNNYYLKIITPINKLKQITTKNQIILDNNIYNYQVYKIVNDKNDNNSQIVYLKIDNLESSYKINNYSVKVKIIEEEKKIIEFLRI